MRRLALGVALLLTACSPAASPSPSQVGSGTPSASQSATISPTPVADSELPLRVAIEGELLDGSNLTTVVERMHEAEAGLPVLKLDVTATSVTMSVLTEGDRVDALRWLDGEVSRVDSDVQYLNQATFDPSDYPLDQVRRMFDVADLRGVRGEEQVFQIVEYRPGQVAASVSSRPASTTVFFRTDGTAVADLGITGVADITEGLAEVLGDDTEAYAVGFNATRGYWADLVDDEPGVVRNRTRLRGLPVFETRRNETPSLKRFDPRQIDGAALAKAIARAQEDPAEECDVVIDMSLERSGPVVRIDCQGRVSYADLAGRDMTSLIS